MTKIVSEFPPYQLATDDARSDEDLLSEKLAVTAGNTATLWGYVTNVEDFADDQGNPCPPAPGTGAPGHDHSGGYYGRPLFRSVFTLNLNVYDEAGFTSVGADLAYQRSSWGIRRTNIGVGLTAKAGHGSREMSIVPVPVPGCCPLRGAYNALAIMADWEWDDAHSLNSADTATLRILNLTTGHAIEFDVDPDSFSMQRFQSDPSDDPSTLLLMAPGRLNMITAEMVVTLDSGGTSRDAIGYLTALEGGVVET